MRADLGPKALRSRRRILLLMRELDREIENHGTSTHVLHVYMMMILLSSPYQLTTPNLMWLCVRLAIGRRSHWRGSCHWMFTGSTVKDVLGREILLAHASIEQLMKAQRCGR